VGDDMSGHDFESSEIAYWKVFRLVFVIFMLYLVGDVFYRWDGFRYYSNFSSFIPSIALIMIIWSAIAGFAALILWILLKIMQWVSIRMRWRRTAEHVLLLISMMVFFMMMFWVAKKIGWQNMSLTSHVKSMLIIVAIISAFSMTWIFRNRIRLIQESITPLVWLFGIWFIISVPLVIYHAQIKDGGVVVSHKNGSPVAISDEIRPNFIVVIFDALSAKDMSVYDYERPTTPFIKKWAEDAAVFKRFEAASTYTTPTISSLMTGKRLWTHRVFHPNGSVPLLSKTESLPRILKDNNYYNMAFIVNSLASVKAMGVAESFDIAPESVEFFREPDTVIQKIQLTLFRLFDGKIQLYDWLFKGDFIFRLLTKRLSVDLSVHRVPPEKAFDKFLEFLDNNPPRPFFAWIHVLPPHYPYLPSSPYMGMFDPSSDLRTSGKQKIGVSRALPYTSKYIPVNRQYPEDIENIIKTLRARYDEFIRYCDDQFRDFIEELEKRNELKNTVIILTADHGESFGHNGLKHGGYHLYEEVTNIPLIIDLPGDKEKRVIRGPAEQIDISATIVDLANISVPSWMEGRSLVPRLVGKDLPSRPVFSMSFERNPSKGRIEKGAIAVTVENYKLIHYLELNRSFLFDLENDPGEMINIMNENPEIGNRLLNLIQNNLEKVNDKIRKRE
jgi:arylsulfatase A-like enzyme